MSTWPASLPQAPKLDNYKEVPADTVLRTQMDVGPEKTRRRTIAGEDEIRVVYEMDTTQLAAFETFRETTISGGSEVFELPHPRTGATINVRMENVEYSPMGPLYWNVAFTIKVQP